MSLKGKSILVTGAGGFIGSHLVEKLIDIGAHVRAFVHYNALGKWGWLEDLRDQDNLQVIAGDICDRDIVLQAMDNIELVFHLASLIAIPYSYHSPSSYIRTNIEGTFNILQSARKVNIQKLIHTSTSEVYGTAIYVPIDEKHPLQAQSPYAATKIAADKLVESFHLSFDVPVVTVRPFNTFGPRQSTRAVIPTIITQCLKGKEIKLGNLAPTRDFNYVANTVDGFIAAAVAENVLGRTINLGSGQEISIGDLANLIANLTGKNININTENKRLRPKDSEVERLLADNTLAKDLLKWMPSVSLKEGIQITIEWIRKNINQYKTDDYTV